MLTKSDIILDNINMDKMEVKENGKYEFISNSVEDTFAISKSIADKLSGGEVILLSGNLGAGKTTFTKGLAKSLGIEDVVTSPTFTFMKEYSGRLRLYHFDMYRATDEDELYELGLNDYLYQGGVCVIEWNKFEGIESPIKIEITNLDDDKRKFEISGIDLA